MSWRVQRVLRPPPLLTSDALLSRSLSPPALHLHFLSSRLLPSPIRPTPVSPSFGRDLSYLLRYSAGVALMLRM